MWADLLARKRPCDLSRSRRNLGDKFLLNYGLANGVQRQNLSFEILDVLGSVEDTWWRGFLGGGLVGLRNSAAHLTAQPAVIQWGLQPRRPLRGALERFAHNRLRPARGW